MCLCFLINLTDVSVKRAAAPPQDTGRLAEAEELCARLMDAGGPAKERAKALAREIRSLATYGGGGREPGGGGGGGGPLAPHRGGLGLGLGLGPGGGLTHAPMDADTPMGGTPGGRVSGRGVGRVVLDRDRARVAARTWGSDQREGSGGCCSHTVSVI